MTAPANGAFFGVGVNVNMAASADDVDGTVTAVVFYSNNTVLCTDTAAPWECQLPNVSAGNYTLKAVAKDNNGASTESAAVTITVTTTPPTATPTPTNTPVPSTPTPTVGPGTPTPIPATATPTNSASLTIPGSTSGAPGSQFIVMGAGFTPNAAVTLYVNGAALGSLWPTVAVVLAPCW
ncbi:MAG: Ig-like domain-containing protein [Caldilineaceae bacterium]